MRTTTYPNAMVERSSTQTTGPLAPSMTKTIPFDYVFEFKLKGKDANNAQDVVKLQDVVEISMQGVFVAVSLGYSFVLDESKVPRAFSPVVNQTTLSFTPLAVFIGPQGTGQPFELGGLVVAATPNVNLTIFRITDRCEKAIRQVGTTKITFIDAVDPVPNNSADLIHSGLDGNVVLEFGDIQSLPIGSNYRIWDRTNNILSEPLPLFSNVVGPDPITKKLPVEGDDKVQIYGNPDSEVRVSLISGSTGKRIPVKNSSGGTTFRLVSSNVWGSRIGTVEVNLSAGGAQKLAGGDLILVQEPSPSISHFAFPISNPRLSDISLNAIVKGLANTATGLSTGFRLSQRAANLLPANPPINQISRDILAQAFEPAPGPEDISFLYSIDIVSSGRELQNKPIHNIAGLGIANGDRPFRPFAQPIAFEPRSVIRIQIEELSTLPGTLYIVLQGYKTLGTGRRPE